MTSNLFTRSRSILSILVGLFLMIAAAPALQSLNANEPTDWPRFLGPHLDGVSTETDWKTDWPEEGPPVLWRANVGIGFSSVSVVGGKLYTMGHTPRTEVAEEVNEAKEGEEGSTNTDGEKKAAKRGTDVVTCLDAETGEVLWSYSYPALRINHQHEGGPGATPTVADGRVYTVSKEGHFLCLDAETGDLLWEHMFEEDLGVKMPPWGFSCSPLVVDGLVIVDGGRTAAYKEESGELVWKTDKFKPGYGSAIDFTMKINGVEESLVAVLNNEVLLVLRLADGKPFARQAWTTAWKTNSTTPIVAGDRIFISTGYQRGCLLTQLSGDRTKGGQLKTIYENKNMSNHFNNSVLREGHLYGIHGNSSSRRNATLRCLDVKTGDVKWKERGLGCGSLMVAGDKLLCLSDQGELVIVDRSPEKYHEIARAKILTGKCWTVPVLSGGLIYARNAAGDLVCVDVRP